MAQRALLTSYSSMLPTATPGEILLEAKLFLLDENGPIQNTPMEFILLWTDTPAQMKTKILNQILEYAAANSFELVTSSDVFLPSFSKG